jgi:hypothetical protein
MSVLNVAEKPSVASGCTKILAGHYVTRQTASKYNPVYEFDFEGQHMFFTSVSGHVLEHLFED